MNCQELIARFDETASRLRDLRYVMTAIAAPPGVSIEDLHSFSLDLLDAQLKIAEGMAAALRNVP